MLQPRPLKPAPSDRTANRRRLNAFDQCMLSINETQQRDGNPGFETLAMIWLERPFPTSRLQTALGRLARRRPVLTGRLNTHWWSGPCWVWDDCGELPLHEQSLESREEAHVLDVAAKILSQPRDLTRDPSVSFHLLHLPDESDVLLMHANHVMIDHQSITLVLEELDRLCSTESPDPPGETKDLIAGYRSRFTARRRLKAFLRNVPDYIWDRWSRRSKQPRQLPARELDRSDGPAGLKIISHRLSAAESEALLDYSRRLSRFPSPSLTILGSVFSQFARLTHDPRPDDLFRTGVGVEVCRQTIEDFQPQNASSVLRLQLTRGEMHDPGRRVQLLQDRFLQVLKEQKDLGIVEANSLFYRSYRMVRRVAGQMIRRAFSFWYAYFAVPDGLSGEFGGVPVRRFQYIGPAWSPPGLTLLVTGFQGRMDFVLTWVSQIISDDQAREFLNGVVNELLTAADADGCGGDGAGN